MTIKKMRRELEKAIDFSRRAHERSLGVYQQIVARHPELGDAIDAAMQPEYAAVSHLYHTVYDVLNALHSQLSPDEEVAIYNAIWWAEKYTQHLPYNSKTKREIAEGMQVCLKHRFASGK